MFSLHVIFELPDRVRIMILACFANELLDEQGMETHYASFIKKRMLVLSKSVFILFYC